MESTGYSLTDQPPAAETDSGYRYADPEQILRSHQRDTEHVDRLRELVTDVARNIRGSRWVIARGETLQVLAKLLYFGLTFASASQTLGEEYVEILPYAVKRSNFPSRVRRIISVLVLSFGPSLFRSLCTFLGRPSSPSDRPETRRDKLRRLVNSEWVRQVPEAWFLWFLVRGRNVDWSKSLLGMRYITAVPEPRAGVKSYEAVGAIMAIPLLSKLISAAWRARNSTTQHNQPNLEKTLEPTSSNIESPYKIDNSPALPIHHRPGETPDATTTLPPATLTNPARQCPLCLSPRGVAPESGGTCVTECGHVFCWGCIQEWGHEKKECPLCRQALRLERLIPAYNL